MDALRLMLLSLLIGASVSTSPMPAEPVAPATVQSAQVQQGEQQNSSVMFVTMPPTLPSTPVPQPTQTIAPTQVPTRAPTKISTGTDIDRELYKGCEGDDVRMLQKLLKNLGYSVSVDGTFGTKTKNAVISFQKNNGLKADGIAGTRTIRKLASSSAIGPNGGTDRSSLSYGMSGTDVRDLQTRLQALGYYTDTCSGNYLTNTRSAVRWFQEVNGLTVDGIAGPTTLSRVYSTSAVYAPTSPIGPTASPSSFYRTLRLGMSGSDVTYLQQLLKSLNYFTGSVTDYFGTATEQAVSTFQSYNGLTADGVAGSSTQWKLLDRNAVPYPGGSVGSPSHPSTGATCAYCGSTIRAGEEYIHTTVAKCTVHRTCQSGQHNTLSTTGCGHYMCEVSNITNHQAAACGIHYLCRSSGMDHGRCPTCNGSLCSGDHRLLPCGQHRACASDGSDAKHSSVCRYCTRAKCQVTDANEICSGQVNNQYHVFP